MRKIWVIAAREYRASVRTKAFLVTLFLMPVLMVSSFAVQMVVNKIDTTKNRRIVVVDRTKGGELAKDLQSKVEALEMEHSAGGDYNGVQLSNVKLAANDAPVVDDLAFGLIGINDLQAVVRPQAKRHARRRQPLQFSFGMAAPIRRWRRDRDLSTPGRRPPG